MLLRSVRRALICGAVALVALYSGTAHACVGSGCLDIWSTADGGGALTLQWDFSQKVQTFQSFCLPDNSQCLFSAIDPGLMAPTDAVTGSGFFRLADGTTVSLEIVSADPELSLEVNGVKLHAPGDTALLGTMPTIHVHPSWQIVAPGVQLGDFQIAFRLTADASAYTNSMTFTQIVTNVPPPPSATPTPAPPTPTPAPCPGDCDGNGTVAVNELIVCVNMALETAGANACAACDSNGDGAVSITEIISAVNAALDGCPMPPPATFSDIQDTIFTPTCATALCHDAQSHTGNLDLSAGAAYAQLVNVPPDIVTARDAGLLRVDPGVPDQSFLLIKLMGPPPDQGSQMPLVGAPLSADQIDLIRRWIVAGAQP